MAAQGNKEEEVLANLYAHARSLRDEEKYDEAGRLIETLADKGYPPALVTYAALMRDCGEHQEAMKLLRKAADKGHIEAMALFGCELFTRGDSEEETQEGREWIRKAAGNGDEIACRIADFLLVEGDEPGLLSTLAPGGVPLVELAKGVLSEHVFDDMSAAKRYYSHPDLRLVTDDHLQQLKQRCHVCKQESSLNLKECKGCKGPRYCSIVCQTEHWPQHKKDCRKNE